MKFKTKAQNLNNLRIRNGSIPKIYFFKVADYNKKKKLYLNKIQNNFNSEIAIRSSSSSEDGIHNSNAGMFKSFLKIDINNKKKIDTCINKVIASYKKRTHKNDEILIQKMVKNVKYSGVATSCDKDSLAPYYHINFIEDRDTSLVTSGKKGSKSFIFFKFSKKKPKSIFLKKVINLINELEKKFKNNAIDIEFVFDKKQKLYLVQVRQLTKKIRKKDI